MLLENVFKFWNKMVETCHQKSGKLTLIKFGFLSNLQMKKELIRIINFQKKSRIGNEKRIFKII